MRIYSIAKELVGKSHSGGGRETMRGDAACNPRQSIDVRSSSHVNHESEEVEQGGRYGLVTGGSCRRCDLENRGKLRD